MRSNSISSAQILTVIGLITGMVFVADSITAFGIVFWVLYMVALVLTVLQANVRLPALIAAVQIVLIFVSYMLKPDSAADLQAFINRGGGAVALLSVAYMASRVIKERLEASRLLWLQAGQSKVSDSLIGETEVTETANTVLATLANYMGAQVAVLYRLEHGNLLPTGAFGCALPQSGQTRVADSGLAAEVVRTGNVVVLNELPDGYLQVGSMAGRAAPRHLMIAPLTVNKRVVGVMEFGFLPRSPDFTMPRELVQRSGESIGVAVRSALYRQHLKELLEQTQRQSEELQVQQEELRVSNEELEEQGRALRESQARLENQHAELEQTNVQLEEHTQRLARQKEDLVQAQRAMEVHAQEMVRANQYKSEFLANMSHELRTPLNSSLILSQILCGPQSDSLSDEQRRDYARTVHDANNDLLHLINDILDLSKIEAGHVELEIEPTAIAAVLEPLRQMFEPIAGQRGLAFDIDVAPDAPTVLETDRSRLGQVLKNLLSNAFKFTSAGSVRLRVAAGRHVPGAAPRVAFEVSDSGIGIPPEQQQIIFEAFRQADGTTSRKYGGTGLGLSISRELARLLDGEIYVSSVPGQGSTFTVEIATVLVAAAPSDAANAGMPGRSGLEDRRGTDAFLSASGTFGPEGSVSWGTGAVLHGAAETGDTLADGDSSTSDVEPGHATSDVLRSTSDMPAHARNGATAGNAPAALAGFQARANAFADNHAQGAGRFGVAAGAASAGESGGERRRLILVIEDDARFSKVLAELAHDLNFECAVADNGEQALAMARKLRPSGILLDVNLPDQSGLGVLEQLKRDPATRHIPIHMMSVEDHMQTALELGAVGYVLKPVAREKLIEAFAKVEEKFAAGARRVLVIEDDETLRTSIAQLLRADDVEITLAGTAAEAMEAVGKADFDCVVMDLMLPDASGYDLLERMAEGAKYAFPPVIVYTGRALTRDEEQRLRRYSRSIIIKGAKSPERLLDEVTLFLHRVEAQMPPDQQRLLLQARQRDTVLERRTILLVEDDVRNIFALSSVLEPLGAHLAIARNGREALEHLEAHADVDLVLMDLMMPEMDGLTAMRHIRARSEWSKLPIIALTAKAMADDRKECLDAGANDYIAKPIDVDKLISLCRVWMPK